nr:MAG TPA: hypothetical protein [Crassvirales sp.]
MPCTEFIKAISNRLVKQKSCPCLVYKRVCNEGYTNLGLYPLDGMVDIKVLEALTIMV